MKNRFLSNKKTINVSAMVLLFLFLLVNALNAQKELTFAERYNLTEEEAQIIEATVEQVEKDMYENTGKFVDLDIEDLYWIEDPKAYAQFVIKMDNALESLKNETINATEKTLKELENKLKELDTNK